MPSNSIDCCVRYKSLGFLGYPDYRVGTDGSVWSRLAMGPLVVKNKKRVKRIWKRLKAREESDSYKSVCLYRDRKRRYFQVHTLVLLAFVGDCPSGMVCRHFPDRNKSNNNLDNLQWGTPKDNGQDRVVHGTSAVGEKNPCAKLTEEDVREIRRLYEKEGLSARNVANRFGIHKNSIYPIVGRKSWRHV